MTLQSRAIATNVCQLLTPVVFICFAGLMQIILNIVLKKHGTAVPGTGSLPFPVDISRSLACNASNRFNNPNVKLANGTLIGLNYFNITQCHDNLFNFLDDYPGLIRAARVDPSLNETIENFTLVALTRAQDQLFSLPMFYIGK